METETVKIRTKKGRIITLSIQRKTQTHLIGVDKFNCPVILRKDEIDEMF